MAIHCVFYLTDLAKQSFCLFESDLGEFWGSFPKLSSTRRQEKVCFRRGAVDIEKSLMFLFRKAIELMSQQKEKKKEKTQGKSSF